MSEQGSLIALRTATFTLPLAPVQQGSMNIGAKGQMYHAKGQALLDYRNALGAFARRAWPGAPVSGPVAVSMLFTVLRARSVTRPSPCTPPDLDKYVRACLDALTGISYLDDGQVVRLMAEKRYGVPCVSVRVDELAP